MFLISKILTNLKIWKNKAKDQKFTYELQVYNYKRENQDVAGEDKKKSPPASK